MMSCTSGHHEKRQIHWNGNWAHACDFSDNDLNNAQIRGEDCEPRCESTPGCTHFTWTTYLNGTCWMKQGSIIKDNAYPTNDQSMVCGVIRDSKPTPGVSGRTTRYWDCCKPSCSWAGKVRGRDTYVKSCRSNGYDVFDHPNAASGCNSDGEAFTCNNQQPWAVNDGLAYGFAAAHIPGLSEQDTCCTCYKLDFTSDPLRGKTMIVQITNSGSDVGAHQFDLQIPGGGVGIFNGCQPQWNAPDNGWGERYGGVRSRDECYALPEQIRNGCFFRFDWFRGADNPTMTYSQVDCPQELKSITDCHR